MKTHAHATKQPGFVAPRDTLAILQADQAFIEKLEARVQKHADDKRMWIGREELRNLRRISGFKVSSEILKNRRQRVATVKQYIGRANDRLGERAATLVSERLLPKPEPVRSQDVYNQFAARLAAQVARTSSLYLAP